MKIILSVILISVSLFAEIKKVNLEEAISIALKNNKENKVSKIALDIANAQYKQAISANYPTINAMIVGQRINEDRLFEMKGDILLPSDLSNTFGALVFGNKPALEQQQAVGAIMAANPGMTQQQATQLAIANEAQNYGSISLDNDVKAYGRDTIVGSINMMYALYTGNKIDSVIKQAQLNKLLAKNSIKRSENKVVYDVKRYFYGYYLTNELHKIANSTYNRMKYIAELTKDFYESGESLNVKKTDYLTIQVTVSLIESLVSKLEANRTLINSALVNTMGLKYDTKLEPVYEEKELLPINYSLDELIKKAHKSNSDIRKMDIVLDITKEQIREQKSGHLPKIGLMAEASKYYNSYEFGFLGKDQSSSWKIGFAADIPIFDGFRTTNLVNEKKLENKKVLLLRDMLHEGIAIQIKNELTNAMIGYKQVQTLKNAKKLAAQNRDLSIKGYQIDAIKPEKVIESQYIEAYVKADYLKYVHDYLLSLAKIDNLIGEGIK